MGGRPQQTKRIVGSLDADAATGAAAAVPGIQDAPYGGLSALCVPKYATDLLLPPPMPNVEGTRHHRAGPGCYDFSATRPPSCQKAGQKGSHEANSHMQAHLAAVGVAHKAPNQKRSRHHAKAEPRGSAEATPAECSVDSFVEYAISVKPHTQQSLPATEALPVSLPNNDTCPSGVFGATNVFAYGPSGTPSNRPDSQYNWPAHTIEAQQYHPTRIQWNNELVDDNRRYVPHILKEAVDQTLHWANPKALGLEIDESPCHACTGAGGSNPCSSACAQAAATEYTGPVPIVTHVHGMQGVADYSDGYTEAWYMPDALNMRSYAEYGTWFENFQKHYKKDTCQSYQRQAGSADYIYPNIQKPATAWFHDHTLDLTRLNVYSGMAGFYFIRKFFPEYRPGVKDTGGELPGLPYPAPGGADNPADIRELPLAIQDRLFQKDGSLWYPVKTRDAQLDYPVGVQPPLWLPEFPFSGDVGGDYIMMTVNGRVWPKTTIKPDTYRLRLLNGCNARVLQLRFAKTSTATPEFDYTTAQPGSFTPVPFWVVGNEEFLPMVQGGAEGLTQLTMASSERYDIVVDFSGVRDDEFVFLYNTGPEEPFNDGGASQTAFATPFTSQLLRFGFDSKLTERPSRGFDAERRAAVDAALANVAAKPLPPATRRRQMALMEQNNPQNPNFVKAVLLGTAPAGVNGTFTAEPQMWNEAVRTTTPKEVVEEWDIINLTPDAHPIHLHHVGYETISRTRILVNESDPTHFVDTNEPVANDLIDPMLWVDCPESFSPTKKCPTERDVSLVLPGTRTRFRLKTTGEAGLFVWHCHLVEHEDNEMMVPWCIGPPDYTNPKTGAPMCPSADQNLIPVV